MKKGFKINRMLSVALSLCLMLSTGVCGTTYSAFATADEPQDFVVEHDHNHEGWTSLNDLTYDTMNIPSGNYYLEEDMILTKSITCRDGEVTICLNGHTLTKANLKAYDGGVLTLTDCGDSGVVTNSSSEPVYIWGGTFIMENGTISGCRNRLGGGVYVNDGTFIMNGGSISKNNTNSSGSTLGGGVYVYNGTFIMEGGTISGNSADTGAGVYVAYGDFIMRDGSISDNKAISSTYYTTGGGVYVSHGTFTMEGGTISNNYTKDGGGVCVASGTFTMKGGTITENTAKYNGGGVYAGEVYSSSGGEFVMEGGTISNNTAVTYGGGIYVKSGTFSVSGNPVVVDNTLSDETTESNIGLADATKYIQVVGALTDGAKLGVSRCTEVQETPVLTTGFGEYHSDDAGKYFFYDNAESFGNCDVGTGPDGEAWFGYNVTFKDNSGQTLEEQFVGYNCTATPIDDNCWSTEIDGEEFDFDTPITENMTLYSDSGTMLTPMSSQIRFKRNEDGSYANKFDIRTRAKITDEDFAKYIAETNEEAVKKISKAGFVYACNTTDFSIADAQRVAKGETVSGYKDAPVSYIQDSDGYYMFTCIITDIRDEDIREGVTAYAYICVGDKWYFYNTETTVIFKDLYEANYKQAAKAYGW